MRLKRDPYMLYPSLSIFEKVMRYLSAVTIGFSVDVVVFWYLTSVSFGIFPANLIAFVFGFSINTAMIRILAFPETKLPKKWDYFITFITNVIVVYFASKLILYLIKFHGISNLNAKLLVNSLSLVLNFIIRNINERIWNCFLVSQKNL
jgi:putative flippase GtrA